MQRNFGVAAFQRDLINGAGRQDGKCLLVLPPFGAKRAFPIDVRLDTVAVTDVYRPGAAQSLSSSLQGGNSPRRDLFHVDVEGRLIELDGINAIALQRAGLLIEQIRE